MSSWFVAVASRRVDSLQCQLTTSRHVDSEDNNSARNSRGHLTLNANESSNFE